MSEVSQEPSWYAEPSEDCREADEPGGHRVRNWVIGVTLLLVLPLWAVAAGVTAFRAYVDLNDARSEVMAAERALRDADLSTARERLHDGVALAESSSAGLRGPVLWPIRYGIPVVSPNLRAAMALSDAARDTGAAADDLLYTASTIVHDERESVMGEVSIDYLTDLQPPLRVLAETLERSTVEVQDAGSDSLLGPVERARETYLEIAQPAGEQSAQAAELVGVLPGFLGADEPKTYLLGAASLSELRGSGGLLGSWALLRADGGHLDIGEFVDIDVLGSAPVDVDAPSEEFAHRYARYGSLHQWRNANLSPDFPSAAQVMLDIYEAGGHGSLDGVVLADPVTFQQLVERSGDIEVPGIVTLTANNTLQVIGLDAYAAFDNDDERKRVLGAVAASSFSRVFEILEDDDVPQTVQMLYELANGGHLRVYSTDPKVQSVMVDAGVAGAVPDAAGEFAGVFVNNVAANKVDYFTRRRIDHHVTLLPDGVSDSTVVVDFDNEAPTDGYPRHVLGPWTPHTDAGDNLSLVSYLCGHDCEIEPLSGKIRLGGMEAGRPVADAVVKVPAGGRRRIDFVAQTPDGWRYEGEQIVADIHHLVQPTLFGSELRVRLTVPEGWAPAETTEGMEFVDGELVWVETTSGLVDLEIRLAPSAADDVP